MSSYKRRVVNMGSNEEDYTKDVLLRAIGLYQAICDLELELGADLDPEYYRDSPTLVQYLKTKDQESERKGLAYIKQYTEAQGGDFEDFLLTVCHLLCYEYKLGPRFIEVRLEVNQITTVHEGIAYKVAMLPRAKRMAWELIPHIQSDEIRTWLIQRPAPGEFREVGNSIIISVGHG